MVQGPSARAEGEDSGRQCLSQALLREDRQPLPPCRVLTGGPAGLWLTAEGCGLAGRLFLLDGGHLPRWVLAVPCTIVSIPYSSPFSPISPGCPAHTEGL